MTSICKDASSPSSFSFCTTGTPESHGSPFIRDVLQKFGYLTLAKPLFRPLISDITSTKHQKLPTELPEEFRTVPDVSSPLRKRFECRWSCRFNVIAAVWGVHRWVEGNVIGTCHVNILVYDWGYLRLLSERKFHLCFYFSPKGCQLQKGVALFEGVVKVLIFLDQRSQKVPPKYWLSDFSSIFLVPCLGL